VPASPFPDSGALAAPDPPVAVRWGLGYARVMRKAKVTNTRGIGWLVGTFRCTRAVLNSAVEDAIHSGLVRADQLEITGEPPAITVLRHMEQKDDWSLALLIGFIMGNGRGRIELV